MFIKKPALTKHVIVAMAWREIKPAELFAVLGTQPTLSKTDGRKWVYRAKLPGKPHPLQVVLAADKAAVVSAYWKGKPDPTTPKPTLDQAKAWLAKA